MIVLGLILLLLGFPAGTSVVWAVGIALLVVGVVLALIGSRWRAVGGRRRWH
ncbi:hypothetical protein ABEU19_001128 [Prescottella soli]|uniref:LPXTG cell wall anchor domain-containing protein n=1 Tax=Prescottella soli TaxID=1543852 RepID=A0ABW9FQX0_9NOCA